MSKLCILCPIMTELGCCETKSKNRWRPSPTEVVSIIDYNKDSNVKTLYIVSYHDRVGMLWNKVKKQVKAITYWGGFHRISFQFQNTSNECKSCCSRGTIANFAWWPQVYIETFIYSFNTFNLNYFKSSSCNWIYKEFTTLVTPDLLKKIVIFFLLDEVYFES